MKTGSVVYDVELEDYKVGYSATVAPLVVKDKVIIGIAGAEYGIRGFIEAYDAQTGKKRVAVLHRGRARANTAATPGRRVTRTCAAADRSGSPAPTIRSRTWSSLAPAIPGPDYYSANREGDNLYTASLVALDADTGKLRWHYQFTPHDVHDWDATQVPVLGELTIDGQPRKVVMFANRNGFFYTHRSRHRQSDRRQAVCRDDVGQGNQQRHRPADAAAGQSSRTSRARGPAPISAAAPTSCRRPTIRRRGCSS